MADDREVLREVWEGKVPVCFHLASEEVVSVEQPDPLYLLVPRQSYFPLVTDKVQRHFLRHIDSSKQGEMWLEDEGQPIKWHIPIGVLFDLSGAENRLPWSLTVHFQDFPESEILHCTSKEAVKAHFMAMVKEADCLKHRGQVINGMQKKDHQHLWLGVQNDKFDQFWSVNRKLMEHTQEELFKHIPFRIYHADQPFTQTLFKPMSESGRPHTLSDLLTEVLPGTQTADEAERDWRVLIQGIETPKETTVQWLSEHFSHPDNFLHISIVPS